MPEKKPKPRPDDHIPDLATLLREKATKAQTAVSIPLDQEACTRIPEMEARMLALLESPGDVRMGQKPAHVQLAREIEELQRRAAESVVTFTFGPVDDKTRSAVREAMGGRDDQDELNLRILAAQVTSVADHEGNVLPGTLDWTYFRDLRDEIGVRMFQRIEVTSDGADGSWSVPFSANASRILETQQ